MCGDYVVCGACCGSHIFFQDGRLQIHPEFAIILSDSGAKKTYVLKQVDVV